MEIDLEPGGGVPTIGVLVELGSTAHLVGPLARWSRENHWKLVIVELPQPQSEHPSQPQRGWFGLLAAADAGVALLGRTSSGGQQAAPGIPAKMQTLRLTGDNAMGFAGGFPPSWTSALRELDAEVLVDLRTRSAATTPRWTGELAQNARLGLLALRWEGGQPTGFQAVAQGRPTSGFQVAIWGPDGVPVGAESVAAPTSETFTANSQMLHVRAFAALQRVVDHLLTDGLTYSPPMTNESADPAVEDARNDVGVGRYLARLAGRTAGRSRRKLLGETDEYWSVALSPGDWQQCDFAGAPAIVNPASGFLADPILHVRGDRTVLFVEEWVWAAKRGRISAMEVDSAGTVGPLRPIIEEAFHLSFPFVFEFEDELYMVPECARQGEQRLYRCIEFPYEWVFERTLGGISGVDVMVFPCGGEWNLLVGSDSTGMGDPNAELHLYRALDPVRGPWRACSGNPVVADSRRARNGGLIRQGDRFLRVSQEYGFREYGVAIRVSEISEITGMGYQEAPVTRVGAAARPGVLGIHQLTSSSQWTAFDFRTHKRIGRSAPHR